MSKYTAGPLHVAPCTKHGDGSCSNCVQVRTADGRPLEPTYGDLLLHAAAPDLLAALRAMRDWMVVHPRSTLWSETERDILTAAHEAIRKTRGES